MRVGWSIAIVVLLAIAGSAILWFAEDLMLLLLGVVGEERALGSSNVVRTKDGSVLLTNPSGMAFWTLPFICLGGLLVGLSAMLAYVWRHRLTRRCS